MDFIKDVGRAFALFLTYFFVAALAVSIFPEILALFNSMPEVEGLIAGISVLFPVWPVNALAKEIEEQYRPVLLLSTFMTISGICYLVLGWKNGIGTSATIAYIMAGCVLGYLGWKRRYLDTTEFYETAERYEPVQQTSKSSPLKIIAIMWAVALVLVGSYSFGHHNGTSDGYFDGYDIGYSEGHDEGYDQGHTDGMKDGEDYLWDIIGDKYSFYYDNAVLVTTTGSKYHHYDCYHIDGRRYYIYNIELAEGKGYEPCLDCFD